MNLMYPQPPTPPILTTIYTFFTFKPLKVFLSSSPFSITNSRSSPPVNIFLIICHEYHITLQLSYMQTISTISTMFKSPIHINYCINYIIFVVLQFILSYAYILNISSYMIRQKSPIHIDYCI